MCIKPIKTDEDYQAALTRIDSLGDPVTGSAESDEFEILCLLIEKYEEAHYPIENPSPVKAIKFRMSS